MLATDCDISLSIRYEALAQPSRMVGTAFSVRPQTQRYEMGRNATPRNDANRAAFCTAEILLAARLIACAPPLRAVGAFLLSAWGRCRLRPRVYAPRRAVRSPLGSGTL